jgi:hypothetical protein
MVGLLIRSNDGRGAARSQTRAGERGWVPKTRKRASMARFRIYRVKRGCWEVVDIGEVVHKELSWSWGCAFTNTSGGEGWVPKTRKRASVARFQVCRVKRRCLKVVGVGEVVCKEPWGSWGRTFTNASGGEGLGAENLKPSVTARFWTVSGCWEIEEGSVGSRSPLL